MTKKIEVISGTYERIQKGVIGTNRNYFFKLLFLI
jgi:hypothetical protein